MRNYVPNLEESLMKFTPADITREQPDAKYKSHGGWFGVESLLMNTPKSKTSADVKRPKGS